MDKVSYVLIGMMAGSIITLFVMALLSIAKKEDKSLERLSKARKESKALKDEAVDGVDGEVDGRVAEESVEDDFNLAKDHIGVSKGVSGDGSGDGSVEISKETFKDAFEETPNADSVENDADTVKVTSKSNTPVQFSGELLVQFPGELDWDTYFNGKHPLDT